MCGIAGVLYRDPNRPVDPTVLRSMAQALAHRGPDGEGFFSAPGIGLAHRRLSIIDLVSGAQPIGNEDATLQVVYNGEIYNFLALRQELEGKGHRFHSRSDCEVLVHLYEELGAELVRRLRGMFAFALWDARSRKLLLARDRVGIKPLYIYRDAEKVVFASEIKAILAHPNVERKLDVQALCDFLAYGMIPSPRSVFARIEKLPPGHTVVVSPQLLDARPVRYWRLVVSPVAGKAADYWKEAVREKVRETVAVHQVADVPIGAFLSGGIDSSVLVAEQVSAFADVVQTFSIGFREDWFDELPYARQVARQFGTRHTEEVLTPDASGAIEQLVYYYDEPFADSSALPTLWLSRLAQKHVKVVIAGDGGDEAFGGYSRYAHDLWEAAVRRRLGPRIRRRLLRPLSRAWPKADWLPRYLRAKTLLANLALEPADAYANTLAVCRLPHRELLMRPELRAQLNGYRPEEIVKQYYLLAPQDDPLAGMITADIHTLLPDDFLVKVDRAAMSCGLEVRPPFLDHELLELAAQVPSDLKVHKGKTKWILKEAYRDVLPAEILNRPKHGFEIPVDEWLRGPLREMVYSLVLSTRTRAAELIDTAYARKMYQSHLNGTGRHGAVLWGLLVLAAWADRYLGSDAAWGALDWEEARIPSGTPPCDKTSS